MLLAKLGERFRVEPVHVGTAVLEFGRGSYDVALVRCMSFHRAVASAAVASSWGAHVVNSATSILLAGDKVVSTALMYRFGVPVPRTLVAFSTESALKAAETLGYPVVIKPVHGSWGRLLALARDSEEVRAIVEHREALGPAYRVHYLQEFVRKPGRDIRAMCIGEEVPVAIYRVSSHWITNTARGGKAVPAPVTHELEDVVLRACRALGVEVGGVDVAEDPSRGLVVLEVNAVPEFKNIVRVTGIDVAGLIANYLYEVAKR
jgi:[lysine-biosynthesis-protein LysW]--L-2-aminoadipate ligase